MTGNAISLDYTYEPMDQVIPSIEARELLRVMCGHSSYEAMMIYAQAGYHRFNAYHNLVHELQVTYWAHACAVNEPGFDVDSEEKGLARMLTVALFHDHNHSGGRVPDAENIRVAKAFLGTFVDEDQLEEAKTMLEVTQFDGFVCGEPVFKRAPTNVLESALRDADLMSIYTDEGRRLLLGLQTEIGKPWAKMTAEEIQNSLAFNAKFLREAPMYTTFGARMKEYHLEASLLAFEELVNETVFAYAP